MDAELIFQSFLSPLYGDVNLLYDLTILTPHQSSIALYQILAIFSANPDISGSQLTDSGFSKISGD